MAREVVHNKRCESARVESVGQASRREFLQGRATWCGVRVYLHKDMVQCVINPLLLCPVLLYGALRRVNKKVESLPASP